MNPWDVLLSRGMPLRFTNHARCRMAERDITAEEVIAALRAGKPARHGLRRKVTHEDIAVIVRLAMRYVQVVTAFRTTTGATDEAEEPNMEEDR